MTSPFVDRVEYQVIGRDNNASRVFRDVADAADRAGNSVGGLGTDIDHFNDSIDDTSTRMRGLIAALRELSGVDLPALGFGDIDTTALERANQQLDNIVIEVDRAGQATVGLGNDFRQLGGDVDTAGTSVDGFRGQLLQIEQGSQAVAAIGSDFRDLRTDVDGARDGVTQFNQGLATVDDNRDAITGIGTDFRNLGTDVDDARANVVQFGDGVRTIGNNRDAITSISTDFRNLGQDIEDGRVVVIRLRDELANVGSNRGDVDNLGTGFRNLGNDIEVARGHVLDLNRDIRSVENVHIKQDVDVSRSAIRTLSSNRDRLERAGLVAGGVLGVGMLTGITNAMQSIPILGPLIAAIAATSAPVAAVLSFVLGAAATVAAVTFVSAFGAAVLGGLAGLTIAAGIVGQIDNPEVKSALQRTGSMFKAVFKEATAAFGPAITEALNIVQHSLDDMRPQLQSFFGAAAPMLKPLTEGVMGFVKNVLPGLTAGLVSAQPIIEQIARWLPKLGQTVGDLFERLGKVAPQLATGLGYMLGLLNESIKVVGIIIENVAKAMDGVAWILNKLGQIPGLGALKDIKDFVTHGTDAGNTAQGLGAKLGILAGEALRAADGNKALTKSIQEAMDASDKFIRSQDTVASTYDAIDRAAKHLADTNAKDLKKGIDLTTQAGRENWQVLRDIASNANSAAKEVMDMTGDTTAAAKVQADARTAFLKTAAAMNISAGDAKALADKMFGIPDVDPTVTLQDKASAGIGGIGGGLRALDRFNAEPGVYLRDQASAGIYAIRNLLYRTNGQSATVTVNYRTSGNVPQRAAWGGPVLGPGPKGVDSKLMLLAPGEHVLTAQEVDAAGGHQKILEFRQSLLNRKHNANLTASTSEHGGGRASVMDARGQAAVLRQALSGMTLIIDDRTGRTAQLIARGG